MTLLIGIVFERHNEFSSKIYHFRCPYTTLKVGDIIEDLRYNNRMQVVFSAEMDNSYALENYKTINIYKLNGKIFKQDNHDKETGVLTISLEEARKWYAGKDTTLKELALRAYKRVQLETNKGLTIYSDIVTLVPTSQPVNLKVPKGTSTRFRALAKLEVIAAYLNDDWVKTTNNKGYYLCKSLNSPFITIQQHIDLVPGITYFRSAQVASHALVLMDDTLQDLFYSY